MQIVPIVLEGSHVRLEPAQREHAEALWAVGNDPAIWRYIPYVMRDQRDMERHLERAEAELAAGRGLLFTTMDRSSGQPIGGTGLWNVDRQHRRLEIGSTWLTPRLQRTAANTEAKLLMLRHCFEDLGCIRVEFKTDSLNQRSRAALSRIGAVEEGIFRNHFIMPDGRYRHSVYFSIIDSDWPSVRCHLEAAIERGSARLK